MKLLQTDVSGCGSHDISKIFPSGYIHFILFGKNENRIWSTHALASKYNLEAKIGSGLYALYSIKILKVILLHWIIICLHRFPGC